MLVIIAALPASAADLIARKAPALEIQAFNWTGFYAGAHLGSGWVSERQTYLGTNGVGLDAVGTNYSTTRSSALGGLNAGYNYQIGRFVIGASGDFSWTRASGSAVTASNDLPGFVITTNGRTDWYATLAARAGIAFNDVLLYGKGGVAWSRQVYDGRGRRLRPGDLRRLPRHPDRLSGRRRRRMGHLKERRSLR
ncbi:porin family protein [Bradyrhizobium sp. INPA01-394B]|uniref:Porin family protein n=1 Tax=Bradyrhizobium campsiandrae TaxID=1729892 RepID=A0ABR7U4C0_9BRAD|nr:porin family protein [Bradyrhizobium campsiandrae]MBC9879820.1 porin family protein [Bradyrhizobium campsiandrae]MBC9978847.1 porin family protein [Bradyrhizobium campsiandrae]